MSDLSRDPRVKPGEEKQSVRVSAVDIADQGVDAAAHPAGGWSWASIAVLSSTDQTWTIRPPWNS